MDGWIGRWIDRWLVVPSLELLPTSTSWTPSSASHGYVRARVWRSFFQGNCDGCFKTSSSSPLIYCAIERKNRFRLFSHGKEKRIRWRKNPSFGCINKRVGWKDPFATTTTFMVANWRLLKVSKRKQRMALILSTPPQVIKRRWWARKRAEGRKEKEPSSFFFGPSIYRSIQSIVVPQKLFAPLSLIPTKQ